MTLAFGGGVLRAWTVVAVVVLAASTARAAFTYASCIGAKGKAQAKLHVCRAKERAKALVGKPADVELCMTKFQEKIAKLSAKAANAGIPCRFADHGNTIADYDTGLTWVETNDADGSPNFGNVQDADNYYTWTDTGVCANGCPSGTLFTDYLFQLNLCTSADGTNQAFAGYAAHCDWRLPTPAELQTILLAPYPCATSPCIDPIFGPVWTAGGGPGPLYWTSTTVVDSGGQAWVVGFGDGVVGNVAKFSGNYVRAVRGGLAE